jgi:hypothetical protein
MLYTLLASFPPLIHLWGSVGPASRNIPKGSWIFYWQVILISRFLGSLSSHWRQKSASLFPSDTPSPPFAPQPQDLWHPCWEQYMRRNISMINIINLSRDSLEILYLWASWVWGSLKQSFLTHYLISTACQLDLLKIIQLPGKKGFSPNCKLIQAIWCEPQLWHPTTKPSSSSKSHILTPWGSQCPGSTFSHRDTSLLAKLPKEGLGEETPLCCWLDVCLDREKSCSWFPRL